jgi:hypothetical protein
MVNFIVQSSFHSSNKLFGIQKVPQMGFTASLEVCFDVAKGFCEQALLTSKVFINKTV